MFATQRFSCYSQAGRQQRFNPFGHHLSTVFGFMVNCCERILLDCYESPVLFARGHKNPKLNYLQFSTGDSFSNDFEMRQLRCAPCNHGVCTVDVPKDTRTKRLNLSTYKVRKFVARDINFYLKTGVLSLFLFSWLLRYIISTHAHQT